MLTTPIYDKGSSNTALVLHKMVTFLMLYNIQTVSNCCHSLIAQAPDFISFRCFDYNSSFSGGT